MDIWNWVDNKIGELYDAGHDQLARIMDDVPSLTVDGHHDKVDALVPEGVALARKLNEKWVEVFLRHWHLQSMVLHRRMARQALPEAVSLLEFSHREDTRDCPQSVCAVQDLANCYDCADGPAYVAERIEVAKETLQRIDPTWPCYACISAEYAGALQDAGRYEEVLSFLDNCDREMLADNQRKDTGGLLMSRIEALMRLGRLEQADRLIGKLENPGGGEAFRLGVATLTALLAAMKGEVDRAERALPEFSAIAADDYRDWLETRCLIARQLPETNDSTLDYHFNIAFDVLNGNGAVRDAVDIGFWAAEAALARGQPVSADFHLSNAEKLLPQLRKDLGASDKLAAMKTEVAAAREQCLADIAFDSVEALLEEVDREDVEIESRLSMLINASQRWPGEELVVCRLGEALQALGRHQEAAGKLKAFIDIHPDAPDAVLKYAYLLLHQPKAGNVLEFCTAHLERPISGRTRADLDWILALYHERDGRQPEAAAYVEKVLAFQPGAFNARLRLANLQRDMEDYAAAAANFEQLIEARPDDSDLLWDRLVIATLMEDWTRARELSAALDMPLSGDEGPIREEWGYVRIQLTGEDGEPARYLAMRTGPVTATIKGVSRLGGRQYYGDELVFEPTPLNELDQTDEDGDPIDSEGDYLRLYRQLKCIKAGGFRTYTLDGVHPGEEVLDSLRESLEQHGVVVSIRSDEEYTLFDEEDQEHQGVYIYLLAPGQTDPAVLHRLLTERLGCLEHPLVWPELAQGAGDAEAAARFEDISDRYGL